MPLRPTHGCHYPDCLRYTRLWVCAEEMNLTDPTRQTKSQPSCLSRRSLGSSRRDPRSRYTLSLPHQNSICRRESDPWLPLSEQDDGTHSPARISTLISGKRSLKKYQKVVKNKIIRLATLHNVVKRGKKSETRSISIDILNLVNVISGSH